MRRGLEVERDALPGLIQAIGHEPRRYEDYTAARAGPSREACLAGVEEADAYLLLLGERYGDPLPDTGLSPTEEEFAVAKRRGIPILVFRKRGVTPEAAQDDFIARVEAYATGRFRRSFEAATELLAEVAVALRELAIAPGTLDWEPLTNGLNVPWRVLARFVAQRSLAILETHVLSLGPVRPLQATAVEALPARLARTGRAAGFFREDQALTTETGESFARVRISLGGRDREAGLGLTDVGVVTIWEELPGDMLGTIIDRASLATRLAGHLRIAGDLAPEVSRVALAVGLRGIAWVSEGDPAEVGRRNSGTMPGFGRAVDDALVEPRDSVPRELLASAAREIGDELAMRLLLRYREAMR